MMEVEEAELMHHRTHLSKSKGLIHLEIAAPTCCSSFRHRPPRGTETMLAGLVLAPLGC